MLTEIVWAVLALLFFLLFSVPLPGQGRPLWYSLGTSAFEAIAYLAATWLCLRNWRSPQIVSGRNVWLCIGLGMLCYFLGNLFFTYWETFLGREAAVSPGDFFFIFTYIFLIIGMMLAVASRRLNLEIWQWGVVAVIAAVGIVIAWFVSSPAPGSVQSLLIQPVAAQVTPIDHSSMLAAKPAALKASPKPAPSLKAQPSVAPKPSSAVSPAPVAPEKKAIGTAPESSAASAKEQKVVPGWATSLEALLAPLEPIVSGFYIICDVLLLIIATTLLLAFWGGRFAQSWRMIAAAAFSLYVADIWFKYATARVADYQSGGFLEVFWVFSGVLFGIGAALEHDLSGRSRSRAGTRRRASS